MQDNMVNLKLDIKTLFAGKAWVHQKYLNRAKNLGTGITLVYRKKEMNIPSERVKPEFWTKGDREFKDKFSGEPYYLYGIHFIETTNK